jgi:hypothetical protein
MDKLTKKLSEVQLDFNKIDDLMLIHGRFYELS